MQALVDEAALVTAAVVFGVSAHEFSHVLVLRLFGVASTVEVLPNREGSQSDAAGLGGLLVQVTVKRPEKVTATSLRIAALVPLALALPLVLILAGVLPDPFLTGSIGGKLVLIAWLGCSIPSPQDFSLAWYPETALANARENSTSPPSDPSLG